MLHYRISTHQYFYFYVTTSECWQYLWFVLFGTVNNRKLLFAHSRAVRCIAPRTRRQHSVSSVFFFLLSGMMAPHANITPKHPDIVPIIPFPRHSCQVRASLTESEHTLDRMSLKVSLAFLPRCVYHFGTNRTQKKPYCPTYLETKSYNAVTWEERSERKRQ